MRATNIHRFSKLAWALVLMVVLSCCAATGYAPGASGCAKLEIVNYAWSDIKVYTAQGRRLGGAVGTNERRVHSLCERSDAVLRVQALGGDFDFLISATDQTWEPDRTYRLRVENAVHLSTLLPVRQ